MWGGGGEGKGLYTAVLPLGGSGGMPLQEIFEVVVSVKICTFSLCLAKGYLMLYISFVLIFSSVSITSNYPLEKNG